eukprot:5839892-Pyramimonas_sp.AAC.1
MSDIQYIQLEMSPSMSSITPQTTNEAADILCRTIPWDTYTTAQLLSPEDLQLIRRLDKKIVSEKLVILSEDGSAYGRTFLAILNNITKDDVVQYTLALVKQILDGTPSAV